MKAANRSTGEENDHESYGFAVESRPGLAYNEQAFGHFLALERKRSERSGRPFLLLLVELKQPDMRVEAKVAARVFEALLPALRETDFIGWYREGRIIGAVLTQPMRAPAANLSEAIQERVVETLEGRISPNIWRRQVRVYQVPPHTVS